MNQPNTAITRVCPPPDLLPGYHLDMLIGKGGMGEIYQAVQLATGRTVAIKLLDPRFARDEASTARFEKEGAALASLSHPNIVTIVDRGKHGDICFLAMEMIQGPSLRLLIREATLTPRDAARITLDVARAVEHAHQQGIVHRDLKPENILFADPEGRVPKVTDFGLAGFLGSRGDHRFALTATNVSMGTVAYMAPEQATDAKAVDGRADIFSLGVMLYELLVGEVPRGQFDPPSVLKPGLDPRFDTIVARCLKSAPADRYPTAGELAADLEPLGAPAVTEPANRLPRLHRILESLQIARTLLARPGVIVGAVAGTVLLVSLAGMRWTPAPPGPWTPELTAVSSDLSPAGLLATPGRLTSDAERRRLTLGEGAERVPILAFGRPLTGQDETLRFDATNSEGAARASPEVADLVADTLVFSGEILPPERAPSGFRSAWRWVTGVPDPVPHSALLLQGAFERYVALGVSSGGRTYLEWSLGERRGVMLGPVIGERAARATLSIDREGDLLARVETGAVRTSIGPPLKLGNDWKKFFEVGPRIAVACVGGACSFKKLAYESLRKEAPPAPSERAAPPEKHEPEPVAKVAEPPRPPVRPKKIEPAKPVRRRR